MKVASTSLIKQSEKKEQIPTFVKRRAVLLIYHKKFEKVKTNTTA
jgi:hypothetical protein